MDSSGLSAFTRPGSYWQASRAPRYSLLFALPLLVFYEVPASPREIGWWTKLMLSLGAGLYEELLFRVVLVALLAALAQQLFGWRPWHAGVFATVLGAAIFSTFHYIGPYGDRLTSYSFTFRMIAGIFFSALYLLRGFGITAWTHALYDLFLLAT